MINSQASIFDDGIDPRFSTGKHQLHKEWKITGSRTRRVLNLTNTQNIYSNVKIQHKKATDPIIQQGETQSIEIFFDTPI